MKMSELSLKTMDDSKVIFL